MRTRSWPAAVAIALLVVGCATTRDAEKSMEASFVGKPTDAFFAKFGAPASSFKLNDGGTVYDWIGGRETINVPPVYQTVAAPALPGGEVTKSHSTSTVSNPSPGTTVTTTHSSSFSVGLSAPSQVIVTPGHAEELFCEAQITANAQGVITQIRASRDTRGARMGLSRCAEVFGSK
ncbi:MAG: hypothetical protein JSS46_12635 [Proteobacteria bacterium]|jgi:hypothetical protein|nr:hypothetical protein [Pseudomonadota bacterium]